MIPHYPDDADGDVLHAMAESGMDMTAPVTIEFVIDAPGEEQAKMIEADLAAAGHSASAEFEDGDEEAGIEPGWVVSLEIEMVPEYAPIVELQAELGRIAQVRAGHVDGWGIMA